jgi:hypothetical protein
MKLRENPGYTDKIDRFGSIPAHLFGNMWAQSWSHLENSTKLFPDAPSLDATDAMIANVRAAYFVGVLQLFCQKPLTNP